MKILKTSIALTALLGSGLANAGEINKVENLTTTKFKKMNLRLSAAAVMPSKDYKRKTTPSFEVGLGYSLTQMLRFEVSGNYGKLRLFNKSFNDDLAVEPNSFGVNFNGYLDLTDKDDTVIPYLTGGIGYVSIQEANASLNHHKTSGELNTKKANNFTWNLGAGSLIKLNQSTFLDIGYRHQDLGKMTQWHIYNGVESNQSDYNLTVHKIVAGVVFRF